MQENYSKTTNTFTIFDIYGIILGHNYVMWGHIDAIFL